MTERARECSGAATALVANDPARRLYLYLTQTDAVPERAALCLAISKTCGGG